MVSDKIIKQWLNTTPGIHSKDISDALHQFKQIQK